MAAQTILLRFPGKTEPAEVHVAIEPDIKTERLEDSTLSSEEPSVSNTPGISAWANLGLGETQSTDGDRVTDLSSLDESPVHPILQNFPVSLIAGKPRRFTPHWYSKYGAWLEYSVEKDAIFCKVCRHFGNNLIADKFTRGFRNWKRTHQACSKHELSKAHNTALSKYTDYQEGQQSTRVSLLNQPGNHHHHHHHHLLHHHGHHGPHRGRHHPGTPVLLQTNRDYIKVVLDVLMFCVRQHVAPGVPKEPELANFPELFQLLCKYDPSLKSRFDAIPKHKDPILNGEDIQNDLMDAAASLLLRQIKRELHDPRDAHYAILVDECSDLSERRLVAVCLRYLYGGSIRERVVGFVDTGDTSGEGIALKILRILEPFELDPGLCVGFGSDGAPAMGGVHGALKHTFVRAPYLHRRSHGLNSVLCEASKSCADFRAFSEAVEALGSFLAHGSHRRERFLEIQREMHPDRPPVEIGGGARARRSSVGDVFNSFDAILETLSEFVESGGQAGLEAQSLLQQVQTKKFTFLLVASCTLSEVSELASKGLQSDTLGLSLTQCIGSIERLKQELYDLRHGGFERILTASNGLTDKNEIENWDVSFSRKRKLPSRGDPAIPSSSGKPSRVRCADDLRALWYQILDSQINELDCRFHRDSYCLMKAAAVLRTSPKSNLAENIHPVSKSYSVEISDAELFGFSQTLRQHSSSLSVAAAAGPCRSLIEVFDACSEETFPNLHLLIRILLTLPITACSDERVCSSVNRVKTASRSTMLTAQLNPLSLLSFEKDLTDSLDYDEIIDIFYFIKFIKPFISQGGKVDPGNQPSLT